MKMNTCDDAIHPPSSTHHPRPLQSSAGEALLDDLAALLRRFVVLPQWAPETLALWTLHTYAFELREVSTYLGIESPEKRCGKTTLLSLLSELVNRPVVAANISPSALFRVIEETRPTLLIDEADTFLQGNDELRGILNSGYTRKTAYVVRVAYQGTPKSDAVGRVGQGSDGATRSTLARFSCWCPKVMAAIGRLPDTLADRCIVVRMQRKLAREQCERMRNLDAAPLRERCARFVAEQYQAIAHARPEVPAKLNDRAADIWEPLLILADLAGGKWPHLAREAAVAMSAGAHERSPIGALLLDILIVFVQRKSDRVFSRDLVQRLNWFEDRPWVDLTRSPNGKGPATEIWLARQLRPYGVSPRTIRIGDQMAKGYVQGDFKDTFKRYVPLSEFEQLKRQAAAERELEKEVQAEKQDRTESLGLQ